MSDSPEDPAGLPESVSDGESPIIERNNLGQFVKGVSGNPAGKQKGTRNRTTLIQEALDEATIRRLSEDYLDVLDEAIKLAKQGDGAMIKLVLTEVPKGVRQGVSESESSDTGGKKIAVSITQFLGNSPEPQEIAVNGEVITPTAEEK